MNDRPAHHAELAAAELRVAVLDMQPIDPPLGGGRLRLLGVYHDLGSPLRARYVGTYDWPGPGFRQQMLSPTLEETLVPLSDAHFAAADAVAGVLGGRGVINTTFHELAGLSPDYVSAVRAAAQDADIVVMSHPWVFPLVRDVVDPRRQVLVYDAQNVEGLLQTRLLDDGRGGTRVARGVIAVEYELCHAAQLILACSPEDRDSFARLYRVGHGKIRVAPNGTFTALAGSPPALGRAAERARLGITHRAVAFFIGSRYEPNIEAARFIMDTVAPALPDVLFVIGGDVGAAFGGPKARGNLRITGQLSDEERAAWLLVCDMAVNPMFSGSGTNIKMLDFMAAGLPIVTTQIGRRGIETEADALVVAEPHEFASRIDAILRDPARGAVLGLAARHEAVANFDWRLISRNVGSLLERRRRLAGRLPLFSVIAVVPEGGASPEGLLRRLLEQRCQDFEIVLVGPPPGLPDWAAVLDVLCVHGNGIGSARARNRAAELALGKVLAFTTIDCAPGPDWLAAASDAFAAGDVVGLEGPIGEAAAQPGAGCSPANLFVRTEVFYAAGGFNLLLAEDDLGWRLQHYGRIPLAEGIRIRRAPGVDGPTGRLPAGIGWVSSWEVRCGIAEFSRITAEALAGTVDRLRLVVFADDRTPAMINTLGRAMPCWTVEQQDISRLVDCVVSEMPEVLVVQHHPGLLPWDALARLMQDPQVARRRIIVVLHNTQLLLELEDGLQRAVAAALRSAFRVLVHGFADLRNLRALHVSGNTMLSPLATIPVRPGAPPARLVETHDGPIIGSFGFFFPHKGIHELIAGFALLRRRWPSARLRLVNALYPRADSEQEAARCRKLAAELGLDDGAIEWITDFIPEDRALEQLGECDLVVLPYAATNESASGALRVALASGVPVAVSDASIFEEAGSSVARLHGVSPEQLAGRLEALLLDQPYRRSLQAEAALWTSRRSARRIAEGLRSLLLLDAGEGPAPPAANPPS